MTIKHRAYATLEIKAADAADGTRKFTGVASTINPDRMDDIVMPDGATFRRDASGKPAVPLLWQHNSMQPIGWIRALRVSKSQIEVDCEVYDEPEPGKLKERLDEAWQSIKAGLVRGLSIGFDPIETSRIEGSYGLKFLKWELLELSAVTIPANADASISSIKSADIAARGAPARMRGEAVRLIHSPGDSGCSTAVKNGAVRLLK